MPIARLMLHAMPTTARTTNNGKDNAVSHANCKPDAAPHANNKTDTPPRP